MASSSRGDLLARIIGLLILLLGLGVILEVLWLALQMFRDPTLGLKVIPSSKTGPSLSDIVTGFAQLLFRILLLFLGSISGSLIANKGVNLLFLRSPENDRRQ